MIRINNIINSKVKNKVKVCLFKKKAFYSYIYFHQILKTHEFIQSAAHRSPIFWRTLGAKNVQPSETFDLVRRSNMNVKRHEINIISMQIQHKPGNQPPNERINLQKWKCEHFRQGYIQQDIQGKVKFGHQGDRKAWSHLGPKIW